MSEIADIFETWNQGELKSYLIEITAEILRKKDEVTGVPLIDVILDKAGQKGQANGRAFKPSTTAFLLPLSQNHCLPVTYHH